MTDTELARRKAICEIAGVGDIGEVSDGFHTFNSLYEQRMILFAALVRAYKNKAWKSYRHEDGEYCFGGGWFVVGIDTPEGSYTYHYENKYWGMFDCIDLPRAKHWDGHTEADAETRLMSLTPEPEPEWIPIEMHPATDEEQESRPDIDYWFDCQMPNDGEEILITVKDSKGRRWTEKDVCYVEDGYGLDSGYDWLNDVVAWCELPEPYKGDVKNV